MRKSAILDEIHTNLKKEGFVVRLEESKRIMKIVFNSLFSLITKGVEVKIYEFGTFKSTLKSFNSSISGELKSYERWMIKFTPSKLMKNRINGAQTRKN